MSRTTRLLDLIQLLRRHRRPVSGSAIAQELGISLRTLYRDIATLQGQGAAIDGAPGLGYVLREGFVLPPLMFSAEELEAVVLGMRWVAQRADSGLAAAARDALAKIGAVLPRALQAELEGSTLLVAGLQQAPGPAPGSAQAEAPAIDPALQDAEQALSRLTSRPAAGLKVIEQLPEATMLRIETASGKREVYSLLRNRAHSNVAFLLGEAYRYQPGLDTVTIYPGVLSSYPNFMFNIPARQVPEFVALMEQAKDAVIEALVQVLKPRGILFKNDSAARDAEGLTRYVETAFGVVPEWVALEENGVKFEAPVLAGQKTGWFYDHRMNRARLAPYAKGKRVLDLYSYIGG